jgi:hypothetical protein
MVGKESAVLLVVVVVVVVLVVVEAVEVVVLLVVCPFVMRPLLLLGLVRSCSFSNFACPRALKKFSKMAKMT